MDTLKFAIAFIACAFLLSGCATPPLKGAAFHLIENIPENKSVVYVYWTDDAAQIKGIDFSISANGEPITDMRHGGYYPIIAEPGKLELSSHVNFKFMAVGALDVAMAPTKTLVINVDKGKEYYVRCVSYGGGNAFNYALDMRVNDKNWGRYELRGAKLLPRKISSTQKTSDNNNY